MPTPAHTLVSESIPEMSYDEWIAAGEKRGEAELAALTRMDAGEPQIAAPPTPRPSPTGRVKQFPDRESLVAALKAHVAEHGAIPSANDPIGKKLRNAAFNLEPRAKWSEIVLEAGDEHPPSEKPPAAPKPTAQKKTQAKPRSSHPVPDPGGGFIDSGRARSSIRGSNRRPCAYRRGTRGRAHAALRASALRRPDREGRLT